MTDSTANTQPTHVLMPDKMIADTPHLVAIFDPVVVHQDWRHAVDKLIKTQTPDLLGVYILAKGG